MRKPNPFQNPLRCVINLGNALLAKSQHGAVTGVSVDLANALAKRLETDVSLLVVENAREAVSALENKTADVGFMAVDPLRANVLQFTRPYLEIEGGYLVRDDSTITSIDQVDQQGHSVVAGLGSAYDLHLSRHLKHAQLLKAESSKEVVNTFLRTNATVAAGVKAQLRSDQQKHNQLRLLPGRFMVIEQAMAIHKDAGKNALILVDGFLENCLKGGLLEDAMHRHGVTEASLVKLTN